MSSKTKLELTWIGKNEKINLEPRILIERPELSFKSEIENENASHDNILIHGDNLLALKALEQDYAGKIKCIYIDPPYNTGNAFEHYDDNLEHSIWLRLMKSRLEILRNLLTEEGLIFVQIDDNEQAYLTVLMDEIFGRKNRLNTICVKMSESSGVKMAHVDKRLPKLKEYVLVYFKNIIPRITAEKVPLEKWNNEYKNILIGIDDEKIVMLKEIISKENASAKEIEKCNFLLKNAKIISLNEYFKNNKIAKSVQEDWKFENAHRIIQAVGSSSVFSLAKNTELLPQEIMAVKSATGLVYLLKTNIDFDSKQPRVQIVFADDNLMYNPGDLWLDIKTTGGVGQEGGVLFVKNKKPEKLIKKIIAMCTYKNDLILDSFLGSGTTAAVAHKMGRKWIGIEMGDHAYTHCKPRMDSVLDGTDQSGISKNVNWLGGGSYKFYVLAPTLIKKDVFGNPVINKEYNADMLAAAMAKHENYQYDPSPEVFWKQGKSSENAYIYTTTQLITFNYLTSIHSQMKENEHLVIACKTFEAGLEKAFKNITIKKIPNTLLGRCEFGKENYNLNIISVPQLDEEEEDNE